MAWADCAGRTQQKLSCWGLIEGKMIPRPTNSLLQALRELGSSWDIVQQPILCCF